MEQLAKDILFLLDDLGIDKVMAVGFSDGANILMRAAVLQPQRFQKLVLAGGNLNPWGVKLTVQVPCVLGYWTCGLMGLFHQRAKAKAKILGLMVREPHMAPEELKAVSCSVLVLAGEKDLIRKGHTIMIAKNLPNASLHFVKGADHFIFTKAPVESGEVLIQFLLE